MDINKNNFATPVFFIGKKERATPLGKMVLPITEPEARNFYQALGISLQRATQMADLMEKYLEGIDGQTVLTHEIYATAVSYCNNLEEVVAISAMTSKFLEDMRSF